MLPRALSNREQGLWICLKESHHKGYIIWKSSHNEFSIFIEWNVSSPQKNHLERFHGIYLKDFMDSLLLVTDLDQTMLGWGYH